MAYHSQSNPLVAPGDITFHALSVPPSYALGSGTVEIGIEGLVSSISFVSFGFPALGKMGEAGYTETTFDLSQALFSGSVYGSCTIQFIGPGPSYSATLNVNSFDNTGTHVSVPWAHWAGYDNTLTADNGHVAVSGGSWSAITLRIETGPGTLNYKINGSTVHTTSIDNSDTEGPWHDYGSAGGFVSSDITGSSIPLMKFFASSNNWFWGDVTTPVYTDPIPSEWNVAPFTFPEVGGGSDVTYRTPVINGNVVNSGGKFF